MDKKTEPKIYTVPMELGELMDESLAAKMTSESACKGFFKFQLRNALYFSKIAVQKNNEFWKKLYELYPELGTGSVSHCSSRRVAWKGDGPYPGAE
jgi:hypothetical protein